MPRLLIAAALALVACSDVDDRPRNLDYVTTAVLAPSCGGATCHSSFRGADGFVFDTVAGARATFQADGALIGFNADDSTKTPGLYLTVTLEQPGAPRMPYAAPLPDVDVAYLDDWLRLGAPGVCAPGPTACLGNFVVPCKDITDGSGRVVERGAYDLTDYPNPTKLTKCANACVDGACQ